jgi:hypothetical protein
MAAQNIKLAATASTLMAGSTACSHFTAEAPSALSSVAAASAGDQQATEAGSSSSSSSSSRQLPITGHLPRVLSAVQAKEVGALLTRLTNENAQFLKDKDQAVAMRHQAQDSLAAAHIELQQLRHRLE